MTDLQLRFTDPARYDVIAAAARAAGVGVEEFVMAAAYERALNTREQHPRWLQGTYRVSHHY
ncbi:DUF1778 domain-containing protein [Nonomuraea insulae]|uniref:DUF1778 domain-containing protein n=1 Tax=Nonomuraea insulae TaxID=1616787 RepID=A0ABW1CXC2_9ACTN